MNVKFELLDASLPNPKNGRLVLWRAVTPNDGYVPNSGMERFATGVSLTIPENVTVTVTSLQEMDARGLYLHELRLDGPLEVYNLTLTIHNLGNSTVKVEKFAPIARIDAVKTPVSVFWTALKEAEAKAG